MDRLHASLGFAVTFCAAWVLIAFLVLPLLVVIPILFTSKRFLSLPDGAWSLRHYETLLTDRMWRKGVIDSTLVALSFSLLAIALGTACAIGCWKLSSAVGEAIRIIALTPMIVPPIIHALGMYRVWVDFGLIDSYTGLIIAHAMKGIPFVVISVSAVLANFDPKLEQAARSLGAGPLTAMRLTVLPNIWPGMLAGGVFAFAISWDEIIVALFLTRRTVYTLPRQIWDGIQDNISPAVAALDLVQLGHLADRYPRQLSGGQQQRVALARAVIFESEVLLLDEPLSALDKNLRADLQWEIKALHARLGMTFVYVTHDQEEALSMSDQIAIIESGRLVQAGAPKLLYDAPETYFIAGFLGHSNYIEGQTIRRGGATLLSAGGHGLWLPEAAKGLSEGQTTILTVRPEKIVVHAATPERRDGINHLPGTLTAWSYLGASVNCRVATDLGEFQVHLPTWQAAFEPRTGQALWLEWSASAGRLVRDDRK